ncbi:mucoidy inhibitor MuiA family protein [Citrifermentans bremense]|uniref:mucoidy inhibitor MuiA family protein n=1 Tax=Citrifermentans bremense TaxID=60035 RepID=UPI0004030D19|nr:mucoidy inhibitor MuiA family protein [Citrifermentans bremense]
MKTLTICSCLILVLCSPFATSAQTTNLEARSAIQSVTVFSDRAQVTRRATLSLKAGTNLVSFDNLPQVLDEDSLRAVGKGAAPARIAGITVKRVFLDRARDQRVRELEDEIAALTRQVESIEAKRKALASQRAFIDSIRVGWSERISKELSAGKPTAAELGEAVRFVGDSVGKVEQQLYEAEAAKKPLNEKIAALRKELEQNLANRHREVKSAQVAIEAQQDLKFDLDLSYLVSQATWEPLYDVRLGADGKEAELVYRAQVAQKTGENWPGVKLSLSTAAPEVGGGAPELSPWHISFYEPPRPMAYAGRAMKEMAAPAPAPMAADAYPMEAREDRVEEAQPLTSDVAQGQTSVLFQVVQPVDVPSDGTRAGSIIASEKVPISAEYLTVPKLSPRVYLKSKVRNKTPYPLLAGEVNIFNDATFVGKSRLKTISSGEEFDLYFGSDDQVKVKREAARVAKKAGLISGNNVTYHVVIELENFKKRGVALTLLDQQPLPSNAEIKVKLEDADPRPSGIKEDGTLEWKLNLAPGERKKVSYDIVIEYPKGRELAGME